MNKKALIKKHEPHPRFKHYIQCYWTLNCSDNNIDAIYRTNLDAGLLLIFNLFDPIECVVDEASRITIAGDFMVGALAKRIEIKPTGSISLFAVQFTPEGLYPFLSMPPVDLSNFCVELEEVWELNGLGVSKQIHSAGQTPETLIQTFEGFFARRMNAFRKHSLSVEKAVTIIRAHKGQIPIETLANQLQISSRHLERKFTERIGVPPKQLCRIFRLKNVLINLSPTESNWSALAVANGYFDQAHFIHEFQFFTGKSPIIYSTAASSQR
ncbi:AraC family transcriptional regulator [uncultured Desulfobacter sp.]|uniref:AraC family transcriptional regulator n=1 Tax=uncultured Desulfobacter sp. TaxID=240139 RepID=UPI002AA747AA|nr:AraC family transcriptional regulator [uncultured Desulfobacter sp.]